MKPLLLSFVFCMSLSGCTWLFGPAEIYTVTYHGNGNTTGTIPEDPNAYEEGDTVTILGNTGSLGIDDGVFLRWNSKADGTGADYAPGSTFIMESSNVNLYAEYAGQYASVMNFSRGAELNANTIVGTAITDTGTVASVECSLDGGAYDNATGTSAWSFTVPSGAPTWRTGTAHTLSVRVTDGDGRVSYSDFSFTRGEYRDFNGDGYRDLFIAASRALSNQGRVYVLFGDENGPPARDIAVDGADVTLIASSSAALQLGYGLAVGDFNGDGYADIAATENGYNTNTGAAYVIHGGPDWTDQTLPTAVDTVADTTITGEQTYDYLGYHMGCGDLDSDGIDDLFVSAHYYGPPPEVQGRMYGFYGSSTGISDSNLSSGSADFSITGENIYDQFGASPLTADFNGDGYKDLYVAAPGYDGSAAPSYRGRAYIFHGTGSRFSSVDLSAANSADTTLAGSADGDQLVNARAVDLDSDGYDDLIVREKGVSAERGVNYLLYGGAAGVPDTDFSPPGASADAEIAGASDGDSIGVAQTGDLDGDGRFELVVSSATANANSGETYVFSGGLSRFSGSYATSDADVTISGAADDYLSVRLVADLNFDGYDDLALGTCCSLTGVAIPEIRIVYSSSAGIPALDFSTDAADVVISGTAAGDYFGWKVF